MTDATKPDASWEDVRAFVAECAGFHGQMVHGNRLSSEAEKVLAIIDAHLTAPASSATPARDDKQDAIQELLSLHAAELDQNEYAYFELAYTRRTEWMAWICSNHRDDDPARKIITRGQGNTPNEACREAIDAARASTGDEA